MNLIPSWPKEREIFNSLTKFLKAYCRRIFAKNFQGPWWVLSSIYQGLRGKTTQKWEQKHKAATGEEALTFSGQEKDLVAFLLTNFLFLTLQLEMKGQIWSQCWQGHSFVPVKLRAGNKELIVLVTLGSENWRSRTVGVWVHLLTSEPEQGHARGFKESILWVCSSQSKVLLAT